MGALSNESLSSIIGDIYDCVLDPILWPNVMIRITDAVDAAYSTIALASSDDNHGRFAANSPWDPMQMRILQQEYDFASVPGLMAAISGDIDTPVSTLTLMEETELQQTDFYRNWAGPQGLREGCITKFVHTADRIGLVSYTTRASRDVVTTAERSFMALLSPHFRRASLIGDLLDKERVTATFYRAALDQLTVPILLTNADGRILYANEGADAMLASLGPIQSLNGIVQAQNPAISGALRDAISSASLADRTMGARGIGLPISAAGQPPAVAYVLPLSEGTARAAFRPACAAIFISTTTSAAPPTDAVLTTLFDLTPAETRVMIQVGSGLSPSRSAETLGISENTLKTHLGRVFAKTNTARQAELVGLISSLGLPVFMTDRTRPSPRVLGQPREGNPATKRLL